MLYRRKRFYEKYVKRLLDILCALLAIIVFWWLYLIIALLVRVKLGSPVLFKQPRPGMIDPRTGQERIFNMYKFRKMTDAMDEKGVLLPEEARLTKFGRFLRATSLDELPQVFNILKGDMSVIGPRPLLTKIMVFMTDEQRLRHTARPGLSGLAQVNGRNSITWEEKFAWDLKYVENITFLRDLNLLFLTVKDVLFQQEKITETERDAVMPYGDYLLKKGIIDREEYDAKQRIAKELLGALDEKK